MFLPADTYIHTYIHTYIRTNFILVPKKLFREYKKKKKCSPWQETHVVFRGGPQRNGEMANLALYFYKAVCRLNPGIVF